MSGPASHARAELELKAAAKKHGKSRNDGGQRVFERWLRHLYTRTGGETQDAENIIKTSNASIKEAHKVMALAKECLKRKARISVQTRQAILEFGFGDEERGRTIFESVLGENPKRMDIWGQYSDQEIKRLRTMVQRREKGLSRFVQYSF